MANQVVANLIAGGQRLGKEIKTSGATIQPGNLVKLDTSGSTMSLGSVSSAFGIAYGHRYSAYRPTSKTFATDEPLTVIWGEGEMLLSSDLFNGGSLPAATDLLYAQASGLWGMQGSVKVGQCIGLRPYTDPQGGTGLTVNLAHVRFNIQP